MKSQKVFRAIKLGVLAIILAVLSNMAFRTAQVILNLFRLETTSVDSFAFFTKTGGELSFVDQSTGNEFTVEYLDLFTLESEDRDQDGLNALEEFRRLSSDGLIDSDNDSVPDDRDSSPNCSVKSLGSRVTNAVLSSHANALGITHDQGLIYLLNRCGLDGYSASDEQFTIINIHPETYAEIPEFADRNTFRLKTVIFSPGLFYLVRSSYDCGKLCGDYRYLIVVDVPFWGPVVVSDFLNRVS